MNKNYIKVSTLCFAGTALLAVSQIKPFAASFVKEKPIAGITLTLNDFYDAPLNNQLSALAVDNKLVKALTKEITENSGTENVLAEDAEAEDSKVNDTVSEKDAPVEEEPAAMDDEDKVRDLNSEYENIGIAIVDNYLNIRSEPGEDEKVIGKLPKDAGATIYDIDENGWAKIKSGKITGYVMSTFLATGSEAEGLAKTVGVKTATVNTETLKVREEPSTESTCITLIPVEEELEVLKVKDDWVRVVVDNDKGWVAKEFVDISYELKKAVANEELESAPGVSSTRASMVAYAKQFLGNRYVWGGTSLTNGTDCSGFTMSIYNHFGYGINRTARAQSSNGTTISSSEARPGDLLFYSNGGGINHVAMCIGNGQVIHASNPRSGIKISNMYYRDPVKAVRIISE